jgi:hypothetical protein
MSDLLHCRAVVELDWQGLAEASMHPLKLRILERAATNPDAKFSPVELAHEFGEKLGSVSYHVRQLHAQRLLKKVGTKPVRGAVQHFYVIAGKALR